jgi:hypothetical protein
LQVLVEVLTGFIVLVTGVHNQVGNVADYMMDPRFVSAKIRPGKEVSDIQSTFAGLVSRLTVQQLTAPQPDLYNH